MFVTIELRQYLCGPKRNTTRRKFNKKGSKVAKKKFGHIISLLFLSSARSYLGRTLWIWLLGR